MREVGKIGAAGFGFFARSSGPVGCSVGYAPTERKNVDEAGFAGARPGDPVDVQICVYSHLLSLLEFEIRTGLMDSDYFAGAGSSATRRSETVSSSNWKCGRRNATAL